MLIEKVKAAVKEFMGNDNSGHGWDHVERVYQNAVRLCAVEKTADREVTLLAALLHDCDDYKLVGEENAAKLSNAVRIMTETRVPVNRQAAVCEIIRQMGYSKALKGIRPQTLEGKIVSDADMLDAMGAMAVIRSLAYTLSAGNKVIFDAGMIPEENLSAENYMQKNRGKDSFINHFFDKLLRLKDMMFLETSRKEAEIRQKTMVDFWEAFFRGQDLPQWLKLLEPYK